MISSKCNAAVLFAALMLAACGDDTPKQSAETSTTAQPQAATAAAPAASDDRLKGCTLNAQTSSETNKMFPVHCINLEITGVKTLKLSNSKVALSQSCADWVKQRKSDLGEVLNWDAVMTPEGQPEVSVSFAAWKYKGPGTYDETTVQDGGAWPTAVTFGAYSDGQVSFHMQDQGTGDVKPVDAKAALDVNADGTVKLVLTGLSHRVNKTDGDLIVFSHTDRINATLTIRCVDPVK